VFVALAVNRFKKFSLRSVSGPKDEDAIVRPCIRIVAPLFTPKHLISQSCAEKTPTRLNAASRLVVGSNGETGMVDYPGRFAWYELITTDLAVARTFYADVMGWVCGKHRRPNWLIWCSPPEGPR